MQQPHTFPGDGALSLCPLGYFRDHPKIEAEAFTLHLHWSRGILPEVGGALDQAADFTLVVSAVEHGIQAGRARLQEVEQRKAELEARSKGGKGSAKSSRRR